MRRSDTLSVASKTAEEEVVQVSWSQVGIWLVSGLLVFALAMWTTRGVNAIWPGIVFAVGRAAISFGTGATLLTAGTAFGVALALGTIYFWALGRTQGTLLWWLLLIAGIVLFSI